MASFNSVGAIMECKWGRMRKLVCPPDTLPWARSCFISEGPQPLNMNLHNWLSRRLSGLQCQTENLSLVLLVLRLQASPTELFPISLAPQLTGSHNKLSDPRYYISFFNSVFHWPRPSEGPWLVQVEKDEHILHTAFHRHYFLFLQPMREPTSS